MLIAYMCDLALIPVDHTLQELLDLHCRYYDKPVDQGCVVKLVTLSYTRDLIHFMFLLQCLHTYSISNYCISVKPLSSITIIHPLR